MTYSVKISLEVIREHARARVEDTSLRGVANQIDIHPTTLRTFLDALGPIHYKTKVRLREWYTRSAGPPLDELEAGVERLLSGLEEGPQRVDARRALLRSVIASYEKYEVPLPTALQLLAGRALGVQGLMR